MEFLLLLIAVHFLADFPFQGSWLSTKKGSSTEFLTYHCLVYSATFVIFANVCWGGFIWLFLSHFIEDAFKGRTKYIKSLWLDQLVHLTSVVMLWAYYSYT